MRKPPAPSESLTTGSNAPGDPHLTIEQRIGREIRRRRLRAALTGATVAKSAGISPGMLSKIESGQISASLRTLDALATALNTPVSALFAAPESRRDCSFVPRGQGVRIERRGTKSGHQYQLLGHSLAGDIAVEPYLITLTTEAKPYTGFQHAGLELIHMLTGAVSYAHEDRRYTLHPGDTLFFDASGLHGPDTLIELPMTYLSVIIYPR